MLRSLPSTIDDALDTLCEPNAVFCQFLGPASVMGNDPPQFSIFRHAGDVAALQPVKQLGREGGEIIDICIVVFGSIALVSLHARGSSL